MPRTNTLTYYEITVIKSFIVKVLGLRISREILKVVRRDYLLGRVFSFSLCGGATTFSIMTFSIMTFSIMTFSIMTFSIMTFSIMTFSIMTFSIMI